MIVSLGVLSIVCGRSQKTILCRKDAFFTKTIWQPRTRPIETRDEHVSVLRRKWRQLPSVSYRTNPKTAAFPRDQWDYTQVEGFDP
jgi:hypothetical protein